MSRARAIAAALGTAVALGTIATAAPVASADQYWSLLGVGQGETVNSLEFAAYGATEEPPESFVNQRDLFNALLPAAPNVTDADLGRFFKPAPIAAPPGSGAATHPRAGVSVVRGPYRVPHVTGKTRSDTWFGAGYVVAEDRLFIMDVLRHAARSRLTELAGPGPGNANLIADAEQLDVTDYSEQDLRRMFDRLAASGPDGARVARDLRDYVDGINAYIAAARTNPNLMPVEYALLEKPLEDWRITDSVAILGLINGYFGLGGGRSAEAAMALQAARTRFGNRLGRRVLADFRSIDDPEAPVVTTKRFPFDRPGPVNKRAVALLDAASYRRSDRVEGDAASAAATRPPRVAPGLDALRRRGLPFKRHASNAMVIPGRRSTTGRPLLVAGPQVDFYSPEIFHEVALKGPGIESRGVVLPGVSPYVLVGRGRDFVWSITTAQGDLADEFAERLCNPNGSKPTLASTHYRYRGRCVPLTRRTRTIEWTPGPADLAVDPNATPKTYTVRSELSAHGPIVGRATVRGRPVAIALARASFHHETESGVGFERINSANGIRGPADFQRAAARVTGSYNFFYADPEHAAYIQSGWYPRRARGTDPTLPAWGGGRWDWRGFDPARFTSQRLPYARLPKDVDPKRGYLVSWNNKQAPGWRASDADWQYGSVHRSQRLERRVRRALRGGGKLSLGRLVGIMGDAGTVDVRGQEVLPWLLRAIGKPKNPDVAEVAKVLRSWEQGGAHRRDRDGDGTYDESLAVALMDAWWTPMVRSLYKPLLGRELMDRIAAINQVDYTPVQGPDTWFYGWMGYVQRDLRAVLGRRVAKRPARIACGRGKRGRCRRQLRATLAAARVRVEQRYGTLDQARVPATCPVTDPPSCDQLDFIAAGAVETPPIPWQDRGTFQQAAAP